MPAPKLPAEEKKDQKLQFNVDAVTLRRLTALSEALEYPNLSEFLRSLVEKALADRKTRIQERIDQIEEDHENKLRKLAQLQATLDEDEPPLAPTADGTF
jgi:Arc/MetJ-type ribon-helix-helix transcriptional regulator